VKLERAIFLQGGGGVKTIGWIEVGNCCMENRKYFLLCLFLNLKIHEIHEFVAILPSSGAGGGVVECILVLYCSMEYREYFSFEFFSQTRNSTKYAS